MNRFNERAILSRFVRSLGLTADQSILDVGCGFGRNLRWLTDEGFHVVGVDINPRLVETVRDADLECMTVEELEARDDRFDVLLMAHIIEHFAPHDLLRFLDAHLDRLKVGGHLIIATPLMWARFFNDFDHVRPYHPRAILSVFGSDATQVQFHARNRLELVDLGLRRMPRGQESIFDQFAARHRGVVGRCLAVATRTGLRAIYRFSGGRLCGRTNGWIGLFRKTASIAPALPSPAPVHTTVIADRRAA
ncbi:MAG: class I SAM-dependent methyltransferase [Planctomycetota bacterium]|jgi:SAM-dependent methyltransferase